MEVIKNLHAKKSTGHDGFSILIIKKLATDLSVPPTLVFNMSLNDATVPDQLKLARVVSIHKKESKNNFASYRLISTFPGFSKILERLVFNTCISFLNNTIFSLKNQFGFRPKHSTNMAVIKFVDKIVNAVIIMK